MAVTRWQQTLRKSRVSLSHPSAWCVVYTQPIIAADRSYNCTNICTHCKCLVNVCNLTACGRQAQCTVFWLACSNWSGTCIYYPVIRDGGSGEPGASIENYGLDGRALGLNSGLPGFKSNALPLRHLGSLVKVSELVKRNKNPLVEFKEDILSVYLCINVFDNFFIEKNNILYLELKQWCLFIY